jgi:hypothetical protein
MGHVPAARRISLPLVGSVTVVSGPATLSG